MNDKQTIQLMLDALKVGTQSHYYCEDPWYSCPKHEDGCANDAYGDECNCGADKVNADIDKAIVAVNAALAEIDELRGAAQAGLHALKVWALMVPYTTASAIRNPAITWLQAALKEKNT